MTREGGKSDPAFAKLSNPTAPLLPLSSCRLLPRLRAPAEATQRRVGGNCTAPHRCSIVAHVNMWVLHFAYLSPPVGGAYGLFVPGGCRAQECVFGGVASVHAVHAVFAQVDGIKDRLAPIFRAVSSRASGDSGL
ncbi:hypothetical protein VZT92_004501 [Zoarces viviparus]|uniref:Uncharacterized protein n=1 Tax=Zoarces viviparus TaxID=48416 RepID=A0AAW1FXB2_ZOAVI